MLLPVQKLCCARAEAYGILLYCNTFSASEVRIITGNPALAARLPKLFHRAFGLRFDRLPEEGESGKLVFQITDGGKLRRIVDLLGFSPEQNLALHINFGLLEEECCRASFLRGVFFAGGSVTDPAKRYHLELATSHLQVSRELEVLLRECGYPPKSVARNGSFITYFTKQSDQIEDFLTLIGAPVAAMSVMSAKLKRTRNSNNRRLNCDSANSTRRWRRPRNSWNRIRKPQRAGLLDQSPDKLQLTAALRLENPELTLSELAEEFDLPVTKSCLNHHAEDHSAGKRTIKQCLYNLSKKS